MFPKAHLSTCPNDIRLGDGSTRHCTVFLLRGKYKASLFSIMNLNRPIIHPLRSSELNNSGIDVRTRIENVNSSLICLKWSSASNPIATAQHGKLRLWSKCQSTRSTVLAGMVFKQPSFSPSRDVSAMVTTSPTLPADVVRLVLEAVHVTHDYTLWDEYGHRARVAWFASMMRVSRMCYIASQQALYHRVKIVARNERSNDLLIRTLIRKPHIAQMVKALYIQSPHDRVRYCKVGSHRRPSFSMLYIIPFATHDWRKDWHAKRQQGKSVQLLRLCTAVTELSLEQPDLMLLTPVLDSTRVSMDRLTIVGIQDVTFHEWESLSQATFWRNLRSIQLLAVDPGDGSSLHKTIYNLDIAFLGFRPFTRLEELQIVGYVEPVVLRRIVDIVRPTLTTLQCDQTNDISLCVSVPLQRDYEAWSCRFHLSGLSPISACLSDSSI